MKLIVNPLSIAIILSFGWVVLPQSSLGQTPFGFLDIHVGMTMSAFAAKHHLHKVEDHAPLSSPLPGEAICWSGNGNKYYMAHIAPPPVTRCEIRELDHTIAIKINSVFVDGKLAALEVQPPFNTGICFEENPRADMCQNYIQVMRDMAGGLGSSEPITATNPSMRSVRVLRWENESSIAEFQNQMCWPSDSDAAWRKLILELHDRTFCIQGDTISSSQTVMIYIDKKLGDILSARLTGQ